MKIEIKIFDRNIDSFFDPKIAKKIVEIQSEWRELARKKDYSRGFLATAFTQEELLGLLEKPSTLLTAYAETSSGREMVGFTLLSEIQDFSKQFEGKEGSRVEWCDGVDIKLDSYIYLYQIVVKQSFANQGVGRALMKRVNELVERPILADVLIEPARNEASILFFKKMGFESAGKLYLEAYRDFGQLCSEILISK